MIRVILVDDQTLVRQGIRGLLDLTPDLRVVAEASDGEAAIPILRTCEAEVVLLDVRMPKRTGLEVLEALAGAGPPCILLTTFDEDAVVMAGLRLGARGFLLKDVTLDQLVTAIRTVAAGGSLVSPAVTERVVAGVRRIALEFPSASLPDPLTPRELDVLRLIAMGQSNREIGDALGMGEESRVPHSVEARRARPDPRGAQGARRRAAMTARAPEGLESDDGLKPGDIGSERRHTWVAMLARSPCTCPAVNLRGGAQPGVTCATGNTPLSSRVRPLLAMTCLYQSKESLGSRFCVW